MRLVFLLISTLFALSLFAQNPTLSTSLDTSMIRIGEQTTFRIKVSGIEDAASVKWPEIKDTLHRKIEVIETLDLDTISSGASFALEQATVITSWDSGYFAIRPLELSIGGKDYKTEALLLSVNTVKVDTTQVPLDIKPIYEEPFSFKDWLKTYWPYLVGLAAIIVALIFILRARRSGQVDVFGPAPIPLIPAHEKALTRLEALREDKSGLADDTKAYYSELTEIIRTYLEDRYEINALEQTSAEILGGLRYMGLRASESDYLRSLLVTADMVKFAKEDPANMVTENHLKRAFQFIEATRVEEQMTESQDTNE